MQLATSIFLLRLATDHNFTLLKARYIIQHLLHVQVGSLSSSTVPARCPTAGALSSSMTTNASLRALADAQGSSLRKLKFTYLEPNNDEDLLFAVLNR
jgi:hypothetical protein